MIHKFRKVENHCRKPVIHDQSFICAQTPSLICEFSTIVRFSSVILILIRLISWTKALPLLLFHHVHQFHYSYLIIPIRNCCSLGESLSNLSFENREKWFVVSLNSVLFTQEKTFQTVTCPGACKFLALDISKIFAQQMLE